MYTGVRLQNFRSYGDQSIELSPAVNIIVGPNASGKTNLLEGLLVLNKASSFRASDDSLVQNNKDWARIDGYQPDGERAILFRNQDGRTSKELQIDGIKKPTSATLPTTLFEPEHLRFFIGSPELRRAYLDDTISQTNPTYKKHLSQYKRALLQRNRLLKKRPPGWKDQMFVWDLKLSDFGAVIIEMRQTLLEIINKDIQQIYSELSETNSKLSFTYLASSGDSKDYRSALLDKLQKNLIKDELRGSTSVGPHRDDIFSELNGSPANNSASRGEARTIVLALKIIELKQLEKHNDKKPLLLLDDVFSELDGARRRALTDHLTDYQTIITTTDADAIIKNFMGDHKVIPTSKG